MTYIFFYFSNVIIMNSFPAQTHTPFLNNLWPAFSTVHCERRHRIVFRILRTGDDEGEKAGHGLRLRLVYPVLQTYMWNGLGN